MRCVVQRVGRASVRVNGGIIGKIGPGLLAFIGVARDDGEQDVRRLAEKITGLRIFEDQEGKLNLSVAEVQGEILLVSQFTLLGDCRKGKRPDFTEAARPEAAKKLFDQLVELVRQKAVKIETGQFQAEMEIDLVNQGPVTILLDSKKQF